jgi:hypothetical protein
MGSELDRGVCVAYNLADEPLPGLHSLCVTVLSQGGVELTKHGL